MTQFHWRIPIHGCKGDLASPFYTRGTWGPVSQGKPKPTLTDGEEGRFPYHDYLLEVAKAAEISGFDGALIPYAPT